MERFNLPVEIAELPGGGFIATCPILEGCHAEGRSVIEAIDHMEDVVKAVVEMKSPFSVLAHPHTSPLKACRRCPVL